MNVSLEVVETTTSERPLPGNDPLAAEYFRRCAAGELTYELCPRCGHAQHYPRGICQGCGATPDLVAASGDGTVYSVTVVRQNGIPPFAGMVPYALVLVDLEEGPRVMGNVVDCDPEEIEIGAAVRAFILRVSPEVGLPMWRLNL